MAESARQKRITGRVMHEFKHGELKRGPGGKGGPVKSRRQAIAIALEEAGDSKYESETRNERNLHRTEKKEAEGKTAQQEREGKSHVGASGKRESSRSMGGKDARKPTAHGEKAARSRAHRADGHTRDELYGQAQRRHIEGRSKMTKRQLECARRFAGTGDPMTEQAISPLRRRMIEDMTIRKFAAETQHDYVQRVEDFAGFLGGSPDACSRALIRLRAGSDRGPGHSPRSPAPGGPVRSSCRYRLPAVRSDRARARATAAPACRSHCFAAPFARKPFKQFLARHQLPPQINGRKESHSNGVCYSLRRRTFARSEARGAKRRASKRQLGLCRLFSGCSAVFLFFSKQGDTWPETACLTRQVRTIYCVLSEA